MEKGEKRTKTQKKSKRERVGGRGEIEEKERDLSISFER